MKMHRFILTACVFLALAGSAYAYDVSVPHVIINQIFGGTGGYVSHNFIELYNPTDETVDLTGYALHYRSSPADTSGYADKWYKQDLAGSIPAHHSYLVRCAEDTTYTRTDRTITSYDISFMLGGISVYNKGCSVILTSTTDEIPSDATIFNNETNTPTIAGYVDMLAVSGNDAKDEQIPPAYEKNFLAVQSKKNGIRRINFQDTDDNSADAQAVDYSAEDVSEIFPRCVADGAHAPEDARSLMLAEIASAKAGMPRFYKEYCTEESAGTLTAALSAIDGAVADASTSVETLGQLLDGVYEAIAGLVFRHDEKVPQVYIATDKGNGESYGTTLTKAIGYVPAQIVCVDAGGKLLAWDNDWSAQIKVRGNSTSSPAKKPYNIKLTSKVDLFGFGKSKKWSLLADYYDPTLMRNKIALDLAEKLGLDATPGNQRVEVWVDGSYRGMYLLTEKIEADDNRVNIKTKNGDFLIEMDSTGRQEEGNIYFTSSLGRFFRLREPEDETKAEEVKAKVDEFENVIKSGTWEEVCEYIDLDSLIAYYIVNEYMKTIDFTSFSVFFYCKDGKFYGGPSWDFDRSSGNGYSSYGSALNYDGLRASGSHYYQYLMKYPEFKLAVSKKLDEVQASGLFEEIYSDGGQIDSEADFYADAILREQAVWPVTLNRGMRPQESTYEGNVGFLKTWLASRDVWLKDNLRYGIYDEDGSKYYYVFGQKTSAGFFEYNGSYYYADTNGKISTGTFSVNDNTYYADDTGRLLMQSISVAIDGSDTLNTDALSDSSITLTSSVTGHYGQDLTVTLDPSAYFLAWSVEPELYGFSINNGTLTVSAKARPGTYDLTVIADASSGDLSASAQKTITLTVAGDSSGLFVPSGENVPEFAYQSLMLEGQIGVNFYMYLPEIEGVDYSDGNTCWMDFTISGDLAGNPQVLDDAFTFTEYGITYYGFRCYINSIQMADTITATFHYGDKSITKKYSAKNYLDADFSKYSDEVQELMTAIKDYGHYSQLLLAKEHGFTIGKDYADMPRGRESEYTPTELRQASEDVKSYAFVNNNGEGTGIDGIEYSLNLDASTAINLYLNVSDTCAGSVKAYVDGEINVEHDSGNRYRITLDDIPAHELGKTFTVKIEGAKTFEVKVSALSYVNSVLNNHTDDEELCRASAALYRYYTATMNYRKSAGYKD